MTEPRSLGPDARAALVAYSAGEISAEIALMRLLLALGDDTAVIDSLAALGATALLRVALENRDGLARTAGRACRDHVAHERNLRCPVKSPRRAARQASRLSRIRAGSRRVKV